MRRLLRLLIQHKTVGVADQRPVVCVKEHLVRELHKETTIQAWWKIPSQRVAVSRTQHRHNHVTSDLFIGFGAAKAKDQEMAVGVGAGEALAIRSELAIKNRSVALTLNLQEV